MFKVTVDLDGHDRAEARALAALAKVPSRMVAAAKLGAEVAKAGRTYQDQTGNLTKRTRGVRDRTSANDVRVVLEADTEYAAYVRRRGYMAIDIAAKHTVLAISDALEAVAAEAARG